VRDEFSRYVLELRAMENARSQTVREAELYRDSVRRLSGAEALELSGDGDALGGQKRQVELEGSKGIP
jgi:hypothetical protein